MDHVSLVRRQELLSRARRQRYEWLESCRDVSQHELEIREGRRLSWSLRRECEYEALEEMSREVFPCGAGLLRYLEVDAGDERPLLPAHAEAEKLLATKVEAKLRAIEVDSQRISEDDGTAGLIERLKQPELVDVVRSMQHFASEYVSASALGAANEVEESNGSARTASIAEEDFLCEDDEDTYAEARRRVEAFAARAAATLHKNHEPWRSRGADTSTAPAVETLLYRKLHGVLFGAGCANAGAARRAAARDARLDSRLRSLAFVDWSHLEAEPAQVEPEWDAALAALGQLDAAKAPADKTRRLAATFDHLARAFGGDTDADALLPALVIAVVRCRPARLDSNLRFLKRFGKTSGREAFVVTNLLGACDFLANADHKCFSMAKADFDAAVLEARDRHPPLEELAALPAQPAPAELPQKPPDDRPLREVSAREIRALRLARRAEGVVRRATNSAADLFDDGLPSDFRFLGADPDHLNQADLRLLLKDYAHLVRCLYRPAGPFDMHHNNNNNNTNNSKPHHH